MVRLSRRCSRTQPSKPGTGFWFEGWAWAVEEEAPWLPLRLSAGIPLVGHARRIPDRWVLQTCDSGESPMMEHHLLPLPWTWKMPCQQGVSRQSDIVLGFEVICRSLIKEAVVLPLSLVDIVS